MSDNDYDFEDFEDGTDTSPAGLRAALKKAKAEAKKANDRAEAAEKAAAEATKVAKKSTLADLLKDAGIDPKFAARADRDGAEATAEGVKAWVEENKDFYTFTAPKADEGEKDAQQAQEDQGDAPAADSLPPELVAAIQASQQLDASGVSPSEVGVLQRIASVSNDPSKVSWDQMLAELKAAGVPQA
jgi:autotransporter translocation and assembly factor TamB